MRYIILTGTIIGMGGSILYTRNKERYLTEEGWHVDVYSTQCGEVIISEMNAHKKNIIPELQLLPLFYSNKKIDEIISKMCLENNCDKIIIESQTVGLSFWGELIAKKFGGKHFVYLLHENYGGFNYETLKFLDFKHQRRELAGITKESLNYLFKGYKTLNNHEKYHLKAVCTNVVEDVENDVINSIEKEDINIGCITRIEKNYVFGMVDEIITFARRNSTRKIQLIIFGSSIKKELEMELWEKTKDIENLHMVITGFLYPIPKKIFTLVDVFIGVAGSARISASEGIPTITIDVNDGKPIGLLGYDTNSSLYRDVELRQSTSQLLDEIIIHKDPNRKMVSPSSISIPNYKIEYISHLKFIRDSDNTKDYYNLYGYRMSFREQVKKIIFKSLGLKGYNKVVRIMIKAKQAWQKI